jgi:hypothetical protein
MSRVVTVFNELGQLVWVEWKQPADVAHTVRVRIGQHFFFVAAGAIIANGADETIHVVTVARSTKAGGFDINAAGGLAQPELPVTSQDLVVDGDWAKIQSPF